MHTPNTDTLPPPLPPRIENDNAIPTVSLKVPPVNPPPRALATRLHLHRWETSTVAHASASALVPASTTQPPSSNPFTSLFSAPSHTPTTSKYFYFDYWPRKKRNSDGSAEGEPPPPCFLRVIADSPALFVRVNHGNTPPSAWSYNLTEDVHFEVESEEAVLTVGTPMAQPLSPVASASTTPFVSNVNLRAASMDERREGLGGDDGLAATTSTTTTEHHFLTKLSLGYGRYIFLVSYLSKTPASVTSPGPPPGAAATTNTTGATGSSSAPQSHSSKQWKYLTTFRISVTHFLSEPAPLPPNFFAGARGRRPTTMYPISSAEGRLFNTHLSQNLGLRYRPFTRIPIDNDSNDTLLSTDFPADAWPIGSDPLLGTLYSIRACHTPSSTGSTGIQLGYCTEDGAIALIGYGGRSYPVDTFEVLCLAATSSTNTDPSDATSPPERLAKSALCDMYTPVVPIPPEITAPQQPRRSRPRRSRARRSLAPESAVEWVKTYHGVPPNAVYVGRESPLDGGHPLVVGRSVVHRFIAGESSPSQQQQQVGSVWTNVFGRSAGAVGKVKVVGLVPCKMGSHLKGAVCVVGNRELNMPVCEVLCWRRAAGVYSWETRGGGGGGGEGEEEERKMFANDTLIYDDDEMEEGEDEEVCVGEVRRTDDDSGMSGWDTGGKEVDGEAGIPESPRNVARRWGSGGRRGSVINIELGGSPPALRWDDDD